jgi:SAM-dependent methyltransferase
VSRVGFGSSTAFSDTAADYAATMAPALAPVAAEVVRRAGLRAGETVLDIGTGTGTAARLALGEGRRVLALDAAKGMLEVAAREVPQAELIEADFTKVPLPEGSVDVVMAVHSLLFAADRPLALREWLRLTGAGGRLSLSVPGPGTVVPSAVFADVYDRYGITWHADDYPSLGELEGWAAVAGWGDIEVAADPDAAIPLADDRAFRTWLRVGRSTTDWSADRVEQFGTDLMAVAPRAKDGSFRLPFGALYLSAKHRA